MIKKNLLIILSVMVIISVSIFTLIQINNKSKNQASNNSCVKKFLSQNLEAGKDYVPGEIVLGFTKDVEGIEALNILKQYDLKEPLANNIIFSRHVYYIEVLSGNSNDFLNELIDSGLFYLADTQLNQYGNSSNIIFAYDNLGITKEMIDKFFNANKQLSIKSIDTNSISLVVKVPKNTEYEWICKLQEDNRIEYAELNYYGTCFT